MEVNKCVRDWTDHKQIPSTVVCRDGRTSDFSGFLSYSLCFLASSSTPPRLPQALQTFFLTQSLERVFHHCTLFYSRPRSCIFYHEGYCGKWSPAVIHAEEYGAVGCIEGWGHFQPQEQHSWPTSPLYAAPLGPVPVSQPPRPLESVRRAHWALTVGVSPTLAGGCGAVWFGQQACTWGHIDLSGKLLCSSNWTGKRCFKWKLWNRLGYEMTFFPVTVLFFNSIIEIL